MEVLRFENRTLGRLIERPNRFLAIVDLRGEIVEAHVHDPGRLSELLFPGNEVAVIPKVGKRRRTRYDLIGARRNNEWAFIHSGYHSEITEKLISVKAIPSLSQYTISRKEVKRGKSRIDFLLSPEALLEVKGCTLIENGVAKFPDAPTERGRRHVLELEEEVKRGREAYILFLVFGSAEKFVPNWETDPKFSLELSKAVKLGVKVIAYSLRFDSRSLIASGEIEVDIR